jgi:aminoglycoside phosphotransferase (APT) family kinase protein
LKGLTSEERVERIEGFVHAKTGQIAKVTGLGRLAGGSSRQIWTFDLTLGDGSDARDLPLVLRLDPTAGKQRGALAPGEGFRREFGLLEAAHRYDVPVPRVYWECEDVEVLGGPFYVMERIEGETIPRRILRSETLQETRSRLPEELGRALARIHAVNLEREGIDWLAGPPAGKSAPEVQLEQIRVGIDLAARPTPTLELSYRWLEQNLPPERDRTLVHGDFRVGNVVVGPEGLRSILDWELAHVGDPHEDLAWMCTKTWRFGEVERPVGGLGQREPFYESYEKASGRTLDRAALRYWEVLSTAKCAVVWVIQLHSYLSGLIPSVEQATIGRRLSETEWDLLEYLS